MKKVKPSPRLTTGDRMSKAASGERTTAAMIIIRKAMPIPGNVCSFLPVWPKDTRDIMARIRPPMVPTVKLCKA